MFVVGWRLGLVMLEQVSGVRCQVFKSLNPDTWHLAPGTWFFDAKPNHPALASPTP